MSTYDRILNATVSRATTREDRAAFVNDIRELGTFAPYILDVLDPDAWKGEDHPDRDALKMALRRFLLENREDVKKTREMDASAHRRLNDSCGKLYKGIAHHMIEGDVAARMFMGWWTDVLEDIKPVWHDDVLAASEAAGKALGTSYLDGVPDNVRDRLRAYISAFSVQDGEELVAAGRVPPEAAEVLRGKALLQGDEIGIVFSDEISALVSHETSGLSAHVTVFVPRGKALEGARASLQRAHDALETFEGLHLAISKLAKTDADRQAFAANLASPGAFAPSPFMAGGIGTGSLGAMRSSKNVFAAAKTLGAGAVLGGAPALGPAGYVGGVPAAMPDIPTLFMQAVKRTEAHVARARECVRERNELTAALMALDPSIDGVTMPVSMAAALALGNERL